MPLSAGLGLLELLVLVLWVGGGAAAQEEGVQRLSFTVSRQHAGRGVAPGDALIETGDATYYLTAMPAPEAVQLDAEAEGQRGDPKYVWTVQGDSYTGLAVGPISFDSCDEGGGVHIELVELRRVPNSNWFDSQDVGVRVHCVEGRSEL